MREPNDWRLTNQERYLKGAELSWRKYHPANSDNDHDHCEFCQAKFMVKDEPDALREGYSTPDGYRWICRACFNDFLDLFAWKIKNEA
jgi:hypothetical protein